MSKIAFFKNNMRKRDVYIDVIYKLAVILKWKQNLNFIKISKETFDDDSCFLCGRM
jgi:hypothetical protein